MDSLTRSFDGVAHTPAERVAEPPADASGIPSAPPALARPRRLRRTEALRRLVREHHLRPDQLVHPVFVAEGVDVEHPIAALAGHARLSVDRLEAVLSELTQVGVPAVLLFGVPNDKDATGSVAWSSDGPVPRAIREIRRQAPAQVVIADVCLCEYTDHGHCGVIDGDGAVLNDATLPLLARAAVAYADAGADIVAPSAMMDGQVAALRAALDAAGHQDVAIMSYSAKYSSAFYGPFRDAAGSTPRFGNRRGYQMDVANAREALREVAIDEAEGADIVMVKPAGPFLDVIAAVRAATTLPLAAYQVSGEYAMLRAAAERGWIDERAAVLESLMGIRRAGADLIITYHARQAAGWLHDER
jgi:porphobilinogen synthase